MKPGATSTTQTKMVVLSKVGKRLMDNVTSSEMTARITCDSKYIDKAVTFAELLLFCYKKEMNDNKLRHNH